MVTLAISTDAPLISGPPQGEWTRAEWERLPDDGAVYEIIGGFLYVSKSPSYFHQWIVFRLASKLGEPAVERGLAYPVLSPTGVFMPGCDPVQPDFALIAAANAGIIRERRVYGVPDLIVEILSPGSRDYDLKVKLRAYADASVPEYVIIDPETRTLALHSLIEPGRYAEPQIYRETDTVTFACLPGVALRVGVLFDGAPDAEP